MQGMGKSNCLEKKKRPFPIAFPDYFLPFFAAALWALVEKEPFGTVPPLLFAVALWMRAAALLPIFPEFDFAIVTKIKGE